MATMNPSLANLVQSGDLFADFVSTHPRRVLTTCLLYPDLSHLSRGKSKKVVKGQSFNLVLRKNNIRPSIRPATFPLAQSLHKWYNSIKLEAK
jgi:hypothetical protein